MPAKKKTKRVVKKSVKKKPAKMSVRRAPKKTVAKKATTVRKKTKPAEKKVASKKTAPRRPTPVSLRSRRISKTLKNLVLFGVLFIISVAIASISNNELIEELFWILAILTGFVAVAFIIVLLILFFMKQIKK